ncbi:hypothetical protein [uncultured Methanobrevibacter sp.]|uniref:hypothetical protein n=1 Tax=uncultured Methanobrevibacter sp. TaxID=253161 RepID=UPI0025DBB37F|nr:hypothetical protein [uncultured Methanobrevibacter sp.]
MRNDGFAGIVVGETIMEILAIIAVLVKMLNDGLVGIVVFLTITVMSAIIVGMVDYIK